MVPELRALRLKEVAMRIQDEFGGDLRAALAGPLPAARKTLKKFPGIADPGADRIFLFAGMAPIAAVPSNGTQVLVRILRGQEHENYGANYREAQQAIAAGGGRDAQRPHSRLPVAETSWTGDLQTHKAEMRKVSCQLKLRFFRQARASHSSTFISQSRSICSPQ
jgi:hypothetical protein